MSARSGAGNPIATPTPRSTPSYQRSDLRGSGHFPLRRAGPLRPDAQAFVTPFGECRTDVELVDELAAAAPAAVRMEDYCHAVEHSIEFQVLVSAAHLWTERSHPSDLVRIVREQHLSRREAGGRTTTSRDFFELWANIAAREGNACSGFSASTWPTWAGAMATN